MEKQKFYSEAVELFMVAEDLAEDLATTFRQQFIEKYKL